MLLWLKDPSERHSRKALARVKEIEPVSIYDGLSHNMSPHADLLKKPGKNKHNV